MRRIVCDTSALVAFGRQEPGWDVVERELSRGGCIMHEANISELCFTMPWKRPEEFDSDTVLKWLSNNGVASVEGFDRTWTETVAAIRQIAPALNLGDGIAVALGAALHVPVLTADKAFLGASVYARIKLIR